MKSDFPEKYVMDMPLVPIPFRMLSTGSLFQFWSALGSGEIRKKVSLTKYCDIYPYVGTHHKRIGKERPVIPVLEKADMFEDIS
jgi:hypothetical protein